MGVCATDAVAFRCELGWHDLGEVLLELLVLVGALVHAILFLLVDHSVEGLRTPHRHCFYVFALCLLLLLQCGRVCLL